MNHLDPATSANVLVEALPYIQEYYGQTVVVKYGGNAMINEELKDAVIHDIVLLSLVGAWSSFTAAAPRSRKCSKKSARNPALSTVCATPTAKPWTSFR